MNFLRSRNGSLLAAGVLLAGGVIVGTFLGLMNRDFKQRYGYAFPDLQNARTVDQAKPILTAWNDRGGNADLRKSMEVDLTFPFFYATLVALLTWRASLRRPTPWVARLGVVLAWAALAGGIADLAENTTMLSMLGDPAAASRISLMALFTRTKLAAIAAALLYLLLSHLDS